jgi:Undecaprenyl-phosphate glucose phosphotransferase
MSIAAGSKTVSSRPERWLPSPFSVTSLPALAAVADFTVIMLAAAAASGLYPQLVDRAPIGFERALGIGLAAALLFGSGMLATRRYRAPELLEAARQMPQVGAVWLFTLGSLAMIGFLMRLEPDVPRGAALTFALAGFAGLLLWRAALSLAIRRLIAAGNLPGPRVVVLGEPDRKDMSDVLGTLKRYGYRLTRTFALPPDADPVDGGAGAERVISDLVAHIRKAAVSEVVVIVRWSRLVALKQQLAKLQAVPIPVKLVAERQMAEFLAFGACDLGPAVGVVLKPAALSVRQRAVKRAFDLCIALAAVILLLPVFLIVALTIKFDSAGPVFFQQRRGGYNGRRFAILKFRTMSVMEDGTNVQQAQANDRRVTRVGRILRRLSIDELPQLVNVLKGDMSLVGPRPHAIAHDDIYAGLIGRYPARHNVKPGITGWAQVNGCRGETAEIEQMRQRIAFDLDYIRTWSLWLDLRILARTTIEVLRAKAY